MRSVLVVSVFRVVRGVVQAAALLAFEGLSGDEIAHVDEVAEFADVSCSLHALEEFFRLLVEQVEAGPGAARAMLVPTFSTIFSSGRWIPS